MRISIKSALVTGTTVLAVATVFAASGPKPPKQIVETVHFSGRAAMTNDGVETNVSGTVSETEAIQGSADNETLTVTAKNLQPSTGYELDATMDGVQTNVGSFTTDSRGGANLRFSTTSKGKKSLGPPPTPLSAVTEVDIVNSGSQSVLTADMTNLKTETFMVKKQAVTNGVTGNVTVSASSKSSKLGLTAIGLSPSTDFVLTFNGSPVATNAANSKGDLRLNFSGSTSNVNVFTLTDLGLTDESNNPVWDSPIP